MEKLKKYKHYLDIVIYRTYAELHADSSRAHLGTVWWILEPIIYMLVFYFVFGVLIKRGGPGFIPFLLCGLVSWKWFGVSVLRGANCISDNANLIEKVYFPKYLLPLVVLMTNTVKFLIVFSLLILFLVLTYDCRPDISWLFLPILIGIQFILTFAVVSFFAAIIPLVPDIKLVLENAITLVFFVSGIFFDINKIPAQLKQYVVLNPMAVMIDSYRSILLNNNLPDFKVILILTLGALIGITISLCILNKYDRVYPKIIMK